MKIFKGYIPELISGIITLIFGILFIILRKNESDGYIVLAVGAQLTATLSLLKSEIVNKFDEKLNNLELFELLDKIPPELLSHATRAIRNCKNTLQDFSNGIIVDSAATIFNMLSNNVNNSKQEILAVHIGKTLDNFEVWYSDYMQNYYEFNRMATERKVDVQRIFIINEEIIHDPQTGEINKIVLNVMRQQDADRIKVFVITTRNFNQHKGFVVIDQKMVETSSINLDSEDVKSKLSYNPDDIETYYEKFFNFKARALTLSQWIDKYRIP